MSKLFYSTTEVANLIKVNRVTIYRWVKDGKIEAYEVGKHIKIPASEVGRLLNGFGFSRTILNDLCGSLDGGHLGESVRNLAGNSNGKKLVVAVDDNENILECVKELFNRTDLKRTCRLLTFSDSLIAAIQIGKEKPDLLLLDIMMSGLDGIQLAEKIKSIFDDVKILFMTGHACGDHAERIADLGAVDCLIKPFDLETLYATLNMALDS